MTDIRTSEDNDLGRADRSADEVAIDAVLDASYRAWAAGDATGMVADYTPDATAIMPGSFRDGRDAIRQSMAHGFAGPLAGTTTANRRLGLRFLGSDAAIVVTESGILFPGQAEVPETGRVHATWVLERRKGRWAIAAYHNSPVQAG
ncbi:MAG: SgcJ/EcaC family oxidoreductase [Microbacteriaceae bacterium]|nr:SgcJ/EcaC family oxidoreductase [Microbacteriaceae bacterium]MCL2795251.1 SgcJ/EcaC family oxidoreductase [Microbacteriaceae bacterium]